MIDICADFKERNPPPESMDKFYLTLQTPTRYDFMLAINLRCIYVELYIKMCIELFLKKYLN